MAGASDAQTQDTTSVLEMIIEAAQSQIALQLESSDNHDVKAIGLLAANLAAVAVSIALSPRWTPWWFFPIVIAALSCGALVLTVRGKQYNVGPNIKEFYIEYDRTSLETAQRGMLDKLIEAIAQNDSRLSQKSVVLVIGGICLVLDVLIGAVILALLDSGALR